MNRSNRAWAAPFVAAVVAGVAGWAWETLIVSPSVCVTGAGLGAALYAGWAALIVAAAVASGWLLRRGGDRTLAAVAMAIGCALLSVLCLFAAHTAWMLGHAACTP